MDVLALELRDQSVETLIISFDSDGFENALDVLCRRRGVTAEVEEKVCRKVLHFDCWEGGMLAQLSSRIPFEHRCAAGWAWGSSLLVDCVLGNRRFNQFNRRLGGD